MAEGMELALGAMMFYGLADWVRMLGPFHFSSTSATNARSAAFVDTFVDTISSNVRVAWAFGGSSCNMQRQWRHRPRLSQVAGNMRRDFTFPYLAQTRSMAYLRVSSSWNREKPFFSALFKSGFRGVYDARSLRIRSCDCLYDLSGAGGAIPC